MTYNKTLADVATTNLLTALPEMISMLAEARKLLTAGTVSLEALPALSNLARVEGRLAAYDGMIMQPEAA